MKKFLLSLISVFMLQQVCMALPNPKSWGEYAQKAKIKEVATVTKIKTDKKVENLVFKTVTFKTDSKTFTGKCTSERKTFRKSKQIIGSIHFNPKKGDLVYVTVAKDGGEISTYQPLTEEEAVQFKQNPQKIKYGLGTARIED